MDGQLSCLNKLEAQMGKQNGEVARGNFSGTQTNHVTRFVLDATCILSPSTFGSVLFRQLWKVHTRGFTGKKERWGVWRCRVKSEAKATSVGKLSPIAIP